jgi:3-hydroxyisobutyrate dehydrogenase-like beta-hydroxyacid dehydrogenase
MPAMADVGILGLGRMGSAMARRVAGAGHRVTVWNRSAERATFLARSMPDTDVEVARSAGAAVEGRDVVLCVLADGDATRAIVLDPPVLAALTPGTVVCDMGTSGVGVARDLATHLRQQGAAFVDAPVSGSVPVVEAGEVLVMAGGEPEAVDAARHVLDSFARKVVYLGPAGAGQTMKLAVNLVVHDLNAAVAEALVLATSAGIAGEAAYDVFEESVIAAPFVRYKRTAFLDPDSAVAMSLDLVSKDLRLITGLADGLGVPVPTTNAAADSVAAACGAGLGSADMAALARFLTDRRGASRSLRQITTRSRGGFPGVSLL